MRLAANMDALVKPTGMANVRFLRKKYVDPTTGKDEWKPIHFGQNKAPTAMGFFGQPLAGSSIAGVGPGAGGGIPGAQSIGGGSGFGSSGAGGSSFGGSGMSGSGFGGSGQGAMGGIGSGSGTGGDPTSGGGPIAPA